MTSKISGGINLDIDDSGQVYIVEKNNDDHHECLATVKCQHAVRTIDKNNITIICKKKNISAFELAKCPDGLWDIYLYIRPTVETKIIDPEDKCWLCGHKRQWSLKDSGKNPVWICERCHAPVHDKQRIQYRAYKKE